MRELYCLGFVHGDLSEFNILNYGDEPIFIDFSQSTMKNDPNYDEYWKRDIKNMTNFFNKLGKNITQEELSQKIFVNSP